jgi:phosphopantothenoylcysteine decarboxylase / phosphopantothenate---cysteine ligase
VSTAAVADYRPAAPPEHKIKKTTEKLAVEMERTVDVIATVAARPRRPFVVGFAAETENVEQNARGKMLKKGLDMIAANEVGHAKAFDCPDNELVVLWRGGRRELPHASKTSLARDLVALIAEVFEQQPHCEASSALARGSANA